MAILGLGLTVFFDLQTPVALADEPAFRWSIAQLVAGHGFHHFPTVDPLAVPEILLASALALLHAGPEGLRLVNAAAVAGDAVLVTALCLRAGANRFWALAAGAMIATCPVMLALATGLMTEPVYLLLLLPAAWFGWDWVESGQNRGWCVAFGIAAMAQRQVAVLAPLAMLAALAVRGRARRPRAGDIAWIAALAAGVLAVIGIPFLAGIAGPGLGAVHDELRIHAVAYGIGTVLLFPLMLGLLTMPLVVAWALSPTRPVAPGRQGWLAVVPTAVGFAGAVASVVWVAYFGAMIFPGEWFGIDGLGQWTTLAGSKPPLWNPGVFMAFEALTAACGLLLFARHRGFWVRAWSEPWRVWLGLLVLCHVSVMLAHSATDRYFLPVLALLLPMMTAAISLADRSWSVRRRAAARGWALVTMAGWLAYFAAGEQDYQAWQVARNEAVDLVHRTLPADQLRAGVEPDERYLVVPFLDRWGRLPGPGELPPATRYLRFALPGDPRPGVPYRSVAPGKVVITTTPGG